MARFPFQVPATRPYTGAGAGARAFGTSRSGGARLHAGCDLHAAVGTPIFAIAAGEIILAPYAFYDDTYALEVHHPGVGVVRYGEILGAAQYARRQKELAAAFDGSRAAHAASITAPALKKGQRVAEGERIAAVGRLASLKMSMLHFELYDEAAKGQSLSGGGQYKRNRLLLNPTSLLLRLERSLGAEQDTILPEPLSLRPDPGNRAPV